MEPFNIQITHQQQDLTLTILPDEEYFKIIYYGAIVAAVRRMGTEWELVAADELEPGDLPLYEHKQGYSDVPELKLNLLEINQITAAIEEVVAN